MRGLVGQHLLPLLLPLLLRARGEEHVPDLEERYFREAACLVGRDRLEQSGQDAGPEGRVLRPQRIRHPDEPLGRCTCDVEGLRCDERQRHGLGQSRADERIGDQAALELATGKRADLLRGFGTVRPIDVEADAARHLLDQVDLPLEVRAEGGRRGDQVVGRPLDVDPERHQGVGDLAVAELRAEHGVHLRCAQPDTGADRPAAGTRRRARARRSHPRSPRVAGSPVPRSVRRRRDRCRARSARSPRSEA